MDESILTFNGIDAGTGSYLIPSMTQEQVVDVVERQLADSALFSEQRRFHASETEPTLAPREGVDPKDLRQTGWAIVFHADEDPAVIAALGPLIDHRRHQVEDERRVQVLTGRRGYVLGESKTRFLQKLGAPPFGPATPEEMPFYILLVGSPEAIPFSFQYLLDVQYAVGRIDLDTVTGYASYAASVVAAETSGQARPLRTAFFGTSQDPATELSASRLITPVADAIRASHPAHATDASIGDQATKDRLRVLVGGSDTPDLLFAATHGLGFRSGSSDQLPRQGALVCQEWPGPGSPVSDDQVFSADDIDDAPTLGGLIAFFFACFGAGTPRDDDFTPPGPGRRKELAPQPFVSALPRRLLGHPAGAALAVIGHVDRAWGYSFLWEGQAAYTAVFEDTLRRLLEGHPVGSALEPLNARHAELAVNLDMLLEDIGDRVVDRSRLVGMWTARNDARNLVLLGDPAVRLGSLRPQVNG